MRDQHGVDHLHHCTGSPRDAPAGTGGSPLSRQPRRDDFGRALDRLSAQGRQVVDAERFTSDTEASGLLSPPSDLADHFGPNGALVKEITLRRRGVVTSMPQSAFAREGLVLLVPGQGPRTTTPRC